MVSETVKQTTTVGNLFEQIGRLYVSLESMTKERDHYQTVAARLSAQLEASQKTAKVEP